MDNTQNRKKNKRKTKKKKQKQNRRQILANESEDVPKAQENQPNHFDTLPDELHLLILKKVPQPQLDSLALVCHRFSCIVVDRSLWKKVVVRHFRMPRLFSLYPDPDNVRVHLGTFMRRPVQQLFLQGVTISLRPALEAAQPSWCLKEVVLNDVQTCPDNLIQIFSTCKQLRKVDLRYIRMNTEVLVALSKNRNIEYLRLHCPRGLEPVGFEILLRNLRKLQEFQIEDENRSACETPINWSLIQNSICENLGPSLLHLILHFPNESITDYHMAQIIRNCPQLQSLNMQLSPGRELTARSLESLQNLKHLRVLYMPLCQGIPPEGYLPLTIMESLLELNVRHCMRDHDKEYIENVLKVKMIKDHGSWRMGTFKTRLGVVQLTY